MALQNGVDIKTVSSMLDHYSAGFTLNTYAHVTAQMKQDAADAIGGVISSMWTFSSSRLRSCSLKLGTCSPIFFRAAAR